MSIAYLFNIIVNSLLSFFTLWLFIELFLFAFRVHSFRTKALLRTFPLIKLVIDPFLYNFSNWSYLKGINPITAEEGSRIISAYAGVMAKWPFVGIEMKLQNGFSFTFADVFALSIPFTLTALIVFSVLAISLLNLFRVIKQKRKAPLSLKKCHRISINKDLSTMLKRKRVSLWESDNDYSPFAYRKKIVFPTKLLSRLSQEEYEAIIAHELEHIKWYDGIARLLVTLIQTIFWWVPTKQLIKSIYHNIECACDKAVLRYHLKREDLAQAITKTAILKNRGLLQVVPFNSGSLLKRRVISLMQNRKEKKTLFFLKLGLVTFLSLIFLMGRLWIF